MDTPETVINLALDALEQLEEPAVALGAQNLGERQIDPRILPNLTHTKVLDASIDGEAVTKPNWNLLLDQMLIRAMKQLSDFDKLQKLCPMNMVKGRKEDEGYGYLAEINLSVQGLDANTACRTVVGAAQGLGMALDIGFMWRPNEKAAHPGERARVQIADRSAKAIRGTAA
ncbi:MAG: hypothetical protein E4G91_08985 [Candidatus Zixiibacteriota bacterium]|nr:MAG: hypothetical protein E4G91_08985 [candidate division Zixibacteria bacterium]